MGPRIPKTKNLKYITIFLLLISCRVVKSLSLQNGDVLAVVQNAHLMLICGTQMNAVDVLELSLYFALKDYCILCWKFCYILRQCYYILQRFLLHFALVLQFVVIITFCGVTRTLEKQNVLYNFLYIPLRSLLDYDVKMPNFTFNGGSKQATTKFSFSFWTWVWFLGIQIQESSPNFDNSVCELK